MWDHDCGCVPVVDEFNTIQGMITDRDVCMAALMQGRSLSEIPIGSAMSRAIDGCSPSDDVEKATELMRVRRVRRVPVLDAEGRVLGVLSLPPTVARTLFDISQPTA